MAVTQSSHIAIDHKTLQYNGKSSFKELESKGC